MIYATDNGLTLNDGLTTTEETTQFATTDYIPAGEVVHLWPNFDSSSLSYTIDASDSIILYTDNGPHGKTFLCAYNNGGAWQEDGATASGVGSAFRPPRGRCALHHVRRGAATARRPELRRIHRGEVGDTGRASERDQRPQQLADIRHDARRLQHGRLHAPPALARIAAPVAYAAPFASDTTGPDPTYAAVGPAGDPAVESPPSSLPPASPPPPPPPSADAQGHLPQTFDDASNFNTSMVDGNGASLNFFSTAAAILDSTWRRRERLLRTSGVGTDSRPSSLSTVTGMTGAYLALEDRRDELEPNGQRPVHTHLALPRRGCRRPGCRVFAATRAPHGKLPTS